MERDAASGEAGDGLEEREETAPTRGSGQPGEAPGEEPKTRELDPRLVAEGGGVPRVDAADAGDPGAPIGTPGTGSGDGIGPGARYEGAAGGSGARVSGLREHGREIAEGEDAPAGGGPPGELPDDSVPWEPRVPDGPPGPEGKSKADDPGPDA